MFKITITSRPRNSNWFYGEVMTELCHLFHADVPPLVVLPSVSGSIYVASNIQIDDSSTDLSKLRNNFNEIFEGEITEVYLTLWEKYGIKFSIIVGLLSSGSLTFNLLQYFSILQQNF